MRVSLQDLVCDKKPGRSYKLSENFVKIKNQTDSKTGREAKGFYSFLTFLSRMPLIFIAR